MTGLFHTAGLFFRAATLSHAGSEADLYLREDASLSHQEGRLEIFHNGEWGAVCDD